MLSLTVMDQGLVPRRCNVGSVTEIAGYQCGQWLVS